MDRRERTRQQMRRERRVGLGYMAMISATVVMWAIVFQSALEVIAK